MINAVYCLIAVIAALGFLTALFAANVAVICALGYFLSFIFGGLNYEN